MLKIHQNGNCCHCPSLIMCRKYTAPGEGGDNNPQSWSTLHFNVSAAHFKLLVKSCCEYQRALCLISPSPLSKDERELYNHGESEHLFFWGVGWGNPLASMALNSNIKVKKRNSLDSSTLYFFLSARNWFTQPGNLLSSPKMPNMY